MFYEVINQSKPEGYRGREMLDLLDITGGGGEQDQCTRILQNNLQVISQINQTKETSVMQHHLGEDSIK